MKPLRPGLLPVIMLVIVIAWALFAVAMLTGTLVSTQKIGNRVLSINTTFPEVAQDVTAIPLALETGRVAAEIRRAAEPVGPQFTQIVDVVGSIDRNVNGVEGSVAGINANVRSINDRVNSIAGNVGSIDERLTAVGGNVQAIGAAAGGIGGNFNSIFAEAVSIDDEALGINVNALTVRDIARDIDDDLERIIEIIPDINQNAASIANNPLVQLDIAGLISAILEGGGPDMTPLVSDLNLPPDVRAALGLLDPAAATPAPELVADAPVLPEATPLAPPALLPDSKAPLAEVVPETEELPQTPLGGLTAPLGG